MKQPVVTIPKRDSHDPRWNELGKYFRGLADAMGLGQWYFTTSHTSPGDAKQDDEEVLASIDICSQSVSATLYVSDSFWTAELYKQRFILTHELLHVVEAPYINALYTGFEATATTKAVVNQLRERFVDQVALLLSPRFCLPPAGFKKSEAKKHKKKVGHVPHNVSRKRGEADL